MLPVGAICRTLADLNLPYECREVVDKDAESVIDEIEANLLRVAVSIMQASHVVLL